MSREQGPACGMRPAAIAARRRQDGFGSNYFASEAGV